MTEQQRGDLDVARSLAAAGVPLFIAAPDSTSSTGFALPVAWQQTAPDPAVVDRWRPGMALCAVMGHGLDVVDVDPRNGGDAATVPGGLPTVLGEAATPSGGMHYFIRSLGAGSRDGIAPGIDVKGGMPDGTGHGFAFLAPTVRSSKVTGAPAAYRWTRTPAVDAIRAADDSGAGLAARIRELRGAGVARLGGPEWWREFVASSEPQAAAAADRAIREKLDDVTTWSRATSNADFRIVLMRAAMTLGGYVGGGYLTEGDAWVRLETACSAVWGAPDADDRRWIEQGLGDGAARPFHVYTPEDEQLFGDAAQAVATTRSAPSWSPFRGIGTEPFDPTMCQYDQEFADAVVARTVPVLRYAADAGSWLVREADVWREREDLSGWAVSMVARLMPLGETPVPKDVSLRTDEHWRAVRRQRFMTSGGASAISRKLQSIVRAGDHPGAIELARLDGDPEVLWAGGAAWDLRASLEVPVAAALDPSTPHMRSALVAPELRTTPLWDAFVATVWPDPELRAWALRVLGVALSGYPDAVLPVLYGPERTGKTSLISLLVKVLGSYAHAADPRLLGAADSTHASVVYALKGRRLSFIDEGPRRGHLASERLKQLTGGGELTGNAMRTNPVTFAPTHTLVMTTNDEPPITDPALRARVRVIPCEADPVAVRAARQALSPAVWEIEAPGVLAAMMRECAAWLGDQDSAASSRAPLGVRDAVDEMAAGQDPVREWATSCCVPADPGTPGRELFVAFARWHSESPLYRKASPPSETAFGRSLTGMGFPWHKVGGLKYRPLSVLGGPGGYAPWEPMPSSHMTAGYGRFPDGSGRFPDSSPTVPSTGSNPWSGGVLASGLDSLDSSSRSSATSSTALPQTEYSNAENAGNGAAVGNRPAAGANRRPDQGLPATDELSGELSSPRNGHAKADPTPATPSTPPLARSVAKTEAAARAADAKISKAEARRQLAEEKRQAAIAQAHGELHALPAVVDRAGNVIPVSVDQALVLVRAAMARSGGHLDVDVETTGYPIGHPDYALRSVQLGDDVAVVVLHPVEHAEAIRTLLAEAPALGAFSATADLVPLAHAGLGDADELWARMHDVVIATKLADPRSGKSDVNGLKQVSAAVLRDAAVSPAADAGRDVVFKAGRWLKQTDVSTPIGKSGWAQIETGSTAMLRYAASDVLDTAALRRTLPAPDPQVYERERLAQRMTARAADVGIRIDGERVGALIAEHTPARAAAAELVREFGVDNPGSSKQVAEALAALGAPLPRSPKTQAPSAAAGAIEPLRRTEGPVGALADAVLTWRHHDTVLGTFLEPYRVLCERGDGRARPTVYTLGTDTGRMSCVRPNLQQLPREGGVRACITADPGQLMIGADFTGVELRVAAALSQDPTLLAFLADGRDLHGEIALQVWGPDAEATANAGGVPTASKSHRYIAKRGVFGRIYGGGIETLAAQVGVSREVMQTVIDTLDALTPGLAAWSRQVREAVKAGHTQFRAYSGRVIHLPREYPHKAPNYCIQGSARELLVDALVRWRDTRWGTATLLPVHDELDVFVPAEDAQEATAELVRCMETTLQGVAIVADPSKPSPFWADSV